MTRVQLNQLFLQSGAAAWGCCDFAALRFAEEARAKALSLCPDASRVLLAAYPYYAGDRPGNLSLYARGEDYHQALSRRLGMVAQALSEACPGFRFIPGADNSPLPEGQIARLAGVGLQGRNGLVIVPPYGSWVFLGTILTDCPLEPSPSPAADCIGCNACVRVCPGGALSSFPFDQEKCLSAITQKKGELTAQQQRLLKKHPLIWGCDLCQTVCPYNRDVRHSPLTDLTGAEDTLPYLASLQSDDLEGLTNRSFRAEYGNRAFAWRGPAVLRRNLALQLTDSDEDG